VYWLAECPIGDQGLVAAAITVNGQLILGCDVCGTVWCTPEDFDTTPELPNAIIPQPPDYFVCGASMLPRVGHANAYDLERAGWLEHDWQDYEPPLTETPLFFVVSFAADIATGIRDWLTSDEAQESLSRTTRAQVEFFLEDFVRMATNDFGYIDFRHYLIPDRDPNSGLTIPKLDASGRAIRLALDRAHLATGHPPNDWEVLP
jgi:hypothetical protein